MSMTRSRVSSESAWKRRAVWVGLSSVVLMVSSYIKEYWCVNIGVLRNRSSLRNNASARQAMPRSHPRGQQPDRGGATHDHCTPRDSGAQTRAAAIPRRSPPACPAENSSRMMRRSAQRVDAQHLLEDPPTVIQGNRVLHLCYRVRR